MTPDTVVEFRSSMSKLANCTLALVLLLGQVFLLEHQLDFDAHQSGEACQVCLVSSPTDDAVAATAAVLPALPKVAGPLPEHPQVLATKSTCSPYSVRAPPHSHLSA